MMSIAMNVLKEKSRSKTLYILAVIGAVFMLLISTGDGLSINGVKVDSFEQRVPVALAINTFIGALIGMMSALQTIPNEIERKTDHLILSRGVKRWEFMISLALGNLLTALVAVFAVNFSLGIFVLILGRAGLMFRVVFSIIIISINVLALSGIVSALSVRIPSTVTAILAIMIYFVGMLHRLLSTFAHSIEGPAGVILSTVMKVMPSFVEVQAQASNALLGKPVDPYPILLMALYVYAGLSLTMIFGRKEK